MRSAKSAKSALILLGVGALAANIIVGCSGDESRPGYDDLLDSGPGGASLPETGSPSTDSSVDDDSGQPQPKPDGGNPPLDASKSDADADASPDGGFVPDGGQDASVVEAGTDAGATATGSACATKDAIQQQACGFCGVQYRLCAQSSDADGGADAGALVWQPWGFCQNEVANGCVPGTAGTDSCGLCGTRARVCQNDCRWAVGACKNEPQNACPPGNEDYQAGLSCAQGGRSRTCDDSCTYAPFSDCFVPGPPTITAPSTVTKKSMKQFKLDPAVTTGRLGGTCPSGTISTTLTAYQYVTVVNPTASTLVVSVWTGQSTQPGAGFIDTVIASYQGDTAPTTDVARKACVKGVIDGCSGDSDPTACVSSWAGLVGTNKVTIQPNSKVVVYVAAFSSSANGNYQLTVRTDSIN